MKYLLGKKGRMTQIFADTGEILPVTIVSVEPQKVVALRTVDKDGYNAVVVGYGERNEKNINKPQREQFGKHGSFSAIREFRLDSVDGLEVGQAIDLSAFAAGDIVNVTGISKGKGFQGVVKRHNFAGGRRSHGQKHSEREPGSIGATGPQRVLKGTRMGGRMGSDRVTVKNLQVVKVDTDKGVLYIKGATPGRVGTQLEVRCDNN